MSEVNKAFVAAYNGATAVYREKSGQVGNQKYKYATLEAVLEMLKPVLAENKLAAAQYCLGDELYTKVLHEDGGRIDFGYYNLGQLTKHQDRGSAITYGRRYSLCSIFGIAQEDDDGASANAAPASLFKNASVRKAWENGVIKLIEESVNQAELNQVYSDNKIQLSQMKNGHEYDALSYEEIMQRFSRQKTRLLEDEESIAAIKEQLRERE